MTIYDFFYKYRNTVTPNHNIEISYNDGFDINDVLTYQNIIFIDSPQDPVARLDFIWSVFTKVQPGASIYMDDSTEEFIQLLEQKFNEDETLKNRYGIAIQHIYGTGYIISNISGAGFFEIKHYSLEEYDKLSNEYIVIGMAKNEKHYIRDWVAYHLRIGFDKIYLYDNNDDPDETYNEILAEYIAEDKVRLIDIRGKKGIQNVVYNLSYYLIPFKYAAIIDIDEFIWFNETGKYNNIKDFLRNVCTDISQFGVMLQWHCYSASGDDKPSDKPIWEANNKLLPFNTRKDNRCEYIHNWCKSIYKSGYRITMNEHFGWESVSDSYFIYEVDCDDNPVTKENLIYIPEDEFNSQSVYVKHFLLRNIDDFYFHKYLRGHAGGDPGVGEDGWAFWFWKQNLNYYTDIAGVLTEKEQAYLIKHGMRANYMFHPDVFVNWFKIDGNDYINETINNIISHELLPISNCFLNIIDIGGIDKNQLEMDDSLDELVKNHYSMDFLSRYQTNTHYFDVMMGGEPSVIRKNIQDPIVINIGIPLKYAIEPVSIEEQKQYAWTLSYVFGKNNLKSYLRMALDQNITTIPKIGIMDNPEDCLGYKDDLKNFLQENNLQIPNNALINNTLIMPFNQYIKLCDFQNKFTQYYGWYTNEEICDNMRGNYRTPYHAYLCSVMSVINNPYFVWPA